MGVSFAGKRVCVTMKHVGLNVAMDAFVNAVMQKIRGGLVVFVADDPGMHSSQNEQDTRYLVRFAKTICFEPGDHDEIYGFSRDAFDVSERFHVPVVVRMVTRLSHSRKVITATEPVRPENAAGKHHMSEWMCLPVYARQNYKTLLDAQIQMREYSRIFHESRLFINKNFRTFGVITAGTGTAYFREILDELPEEPSHLAVGMYPLPEEAIGKLADEVNELIVIEEGYPFIEEQLRSLTDASIQIRGKMDGALPEQGELNPDNVLRLFFPEDVAEEGSGQEWPLRYSQLCKGCPHLDTFNLISEVKSERNDLLVMADIGCYTLGALPPYNVLDAALCMGASIGMAHGAVDAGNRNVIAIIGDSSFYHSGFPGLFDAWGKQIIAGIGWELVSWASFLIMALAPMPMFVTFGVLTAVTGVSGSGSSVSPSCWRRLISIVRAPTSILDALTALTISSRPTP